MLISAPAGWHAPASVTKKELNARVHHCKSVTVVVKEMRLLVSKSRLTLGIGWNKAVMYKAMMSIALPNCTAITVVFF